MGLEKNREIKWTDRMSNEEMLNRVAEKRCSNSPFGNFGTQQNCYRFYPM